MRAIVLDCCLKRATLQNGLLADVQFANRVLPANLLHPNRFNFERFFLVF